MSLTRYALNNRPLTYVLLATILGLGLASLGLLSRREDPDLQGRWVQIVALYPGASADQIEQTVTERLERSLLEVDDVKRVESTSRPGFSVLTVEAADRAHDLKTFRDDLRNRMTDVRTSLPGGVISLDVNDRFTDTSALILAVSKDGATDREREDLAKRVRDRLRRLPDVGQVDLVGEQEERVTISLSAQRMSRLAVTPSQVGEAIARRNVLPSSGGSVALGSARFDIQPTGNLNDLKEIENLVVAAPGGNPVYLRDIATVERGIADPSSFLMRVDGKPAVGISVTMRKGFNITELGERADVELKKLHAELPAGTAITLINDLPKSVQGRMSEFEENLLSGVILILIVMYLFMGMRSALIVGVMLPITILGTFAAMYVFGRDIQQISIAALIIALGLVVDNSIVVVDNIERKMSQGVERERAAVEGVDELRVPLLTSNLTTVASFAPMLLLSGSVGEFIRDLGVVTSLATLVSLLFNYTIAPLIALRFLKGTVEERPNRVRRVFLGLVDRLRNVLSGLAARGLRRPVLTVSLAVGALLASSALIPELGVQFFPSAARSQFTIDVWLPEGRDIASTQRTTERVEAILRRHKGIVSYASYVGRGGSRFYYNVSPEPPTPNYAQMVINTENAAMAPKMIERIQAEANAEVADARVTVRSLEQGPPVGAPIAVRVSGDDIGALRSTAEEVKAILNTTPGAVSVYHNYGELPLALKVKVDEDQAARLGLSSSDVAQATQMGFSGTTVSFLREADKEIPIQLRLASSERQNVQGITDLYLPASTGQVIPLRQVASVSLAPQEGRIVRRNHARTVTVYAFTDGTRLPSRVLADAQKRIGAMNLPAGVSIAYGGEEEEIGRSFTELLLILGVTVAANLLIVIWEFNSFRAALTVLAAVPLSMTGAILGLWATHQPFGFMAFLGIISLSGIVTNHAIVLFEYALAEQKNGLPLDKALLEAGKKRLRPVLLTVMLSIFGVLPQALNGGTLWPPLAWSLIAGLLMSLVLTLVVMPSFYTVLSLRPWQGRRPRVVAAGPAVRPTAD